MSIKQMKDGVVVPIAGLRKYTDSDPDGFVIDDTPTDGSSNPVASGGVKTALDAKQNLLIFDIAPTKGSSNPVISNGIYDAIVAVGTDILKTVKDDLIPDAMSDLPTGGGTTYTFDSTPTEGSSNPVTSDGIKKAIDAIGSSNSGWKYIGSTTNTNPITMPDNWSELFICVYLEGMITAARFVLKEAIDKMPNSYFNLGGYYYRSDDYEQDVAFVDRTGGSTKFGLFRISRGGIDKLSVTTAHYWYRTNAASDDSSSSGGSGSQNVILYNTTGQNTDGTMTQKAITDELDNKQDKLIFDTTPTAGSSNPVTSDGVKAAINEAMGSIPTVAPSGDSGVVFYNTTGQNTDGAMTQKAITDELNQKADAINVPKLYESTGQNTDGAMTQKAVSDILGNISSALDSINGN